MSRLSDKDADALRHWFEVTAAAHAEDGPVIPMPGRPLGLMLLVWLAIQPDEVATYTELRSACRLQHKSSLTNAVELLKKAKFVANVSGHVDARERELHLTAQGRDVVGKLLKARNPTLK